MDERFDFYYNMKKLFEEAEGCVKEVRKSLVESKKSVFQILNSLPNGMRKDEILKQFIDGPLRQLKQIEDRIIFHKEFFLGFLANIERLHDMEKEWVEKAKKIEEFISVQGVKNFNSKKAVINIDPEIGLPAYKYKEEKEEEEIEVKDLKTIEEIIYVINHLLGDTQRKLADPRMPEKYIGKGRDIDEKLRKAKIYLTKVKRYLEEQKSAIYYIWQRTPKDHTEDIKRLNFKFEKFELFNKEIKEKIKEDIEALQIEKKEWLNEVNESLSPSEKFF